MAIIEVKDFSWKYQSYIGQENPYTLKDLNFEVNNDEFFGIIGPSGAGKTTLCYALTGIIPHVFQPSQGKEAENIKGEIRVFGETLTKVEKVKDEKTGEIKDKIVGMAQTAPRIGLLLQDPENQFLRMDLLHEIAFGMELLGLQSDEIERRIKEALEIVGLGALWPVAGLIHPSELSGGQKQRAAIASFLALRPEVLILDEPTSDLDPEGKLSIIKAIDTIRNEYKITTILVEHNPEVIQTYADRVLAIDKGQMIAYGTMEEVYSQMKLFMDHGLYSSDIARIGYYSDIKYKNRVPFTIDEMLTSIEGKKLNQFTIKDEQAQQNDEKIIEVDGLNFWYDDGTHALKDLSFTISKGEFVGLIGQNGAGKTTISRVVAGILRKYKGTVKVMGKDLRDKNVVRNIPEHIGYVFQNPDHQIFMRRVYDEVAYGLKNLKVPASEMDQRVKDALESVGLGGKVNEDPMFLGKGEKRRLAVASILALKPNVMIVDEPTTGQDFRMSEDIMNLLEELNQKGTTIVAITHDMTLVSEHTRRVVVMYQGRAIYDGPTRGFFSDADLLDKAAIIPPLAVRLSHAYVNKNKGTPYYMNAKEWIRAISGKTITY
ncbi:MAG: ABC transporter ATP-binding protein [Nitrososphaerota archaeon]|nr:ABC transporter ATP-binding protein [Nitrososphaerota archaeon]MDG7049080.1 ABC transporter ATP-binding protein [Nitrososphaerota archaeon]MDG7051038.1 ABC transporter ATP-binding protein [Nitrososphaerota archaeon]